MNITPSLQDRPFTSSAGSFPPLVPNPVPPECDESATRPDGRVDRCVTVMLVEERTLIRQGINALLGGMDDIAVIGQVPDCHQAYTLAEKLRPDVVIIALSLALRNGLESLRRTFETEYGSRVLVLIPHHHNELLVEHIASSGVAGCLTEQAGAQLLATAIREVHEKNSFFDHGEGSSASPFSPSRAKGTGSDKNRTRLTSRELEVLQLIAEGNANKQTASKLGISIKTVEKHRQQMMTKLGIHETATLTRFAVYAGIA